MSDWQLKSLCVFCASSNAVDDSYKSVARELGRLMGQKGICLVYGGASIGLMGEVARGVHDHKGHVTGVLPEFFMQKDIRYDDADELVVTQDMRERKAIMDEQSDGFIVLPGGIGTLEEAVEILSLIQLRRTQKPLVFINTDHFYDGLFALFEAMIAKKFAKEETLSYYHTADDPESAIKYIEDYQPPDVHSKWL